jgi:1,6-anhydro-N-acetylmuramate kinase
MTDRVRLVIGCMTGTSIDAIDVAAVEITGEGLGMSARMLGAVSRPLGVVSDGLRALAGQTPMSAGKIAAIARDFGAVYIGAIHALLAGSGVARSTRTGPDLIAVHGQTVYHSPPLSWQLLNAAPIARAYRAPVVFDLRAADLAAGGQGAPITPLADWVLFRRAGAPVAVVNLGGFCNVTVLPASSDRGAGSSQESTREIERIAGFDLCACNQLLDAVARHALGMPYDPEGRHARAGRLHGEGAEELRRLLMEQRRHGRSLGTGDELLGWVDRFGRVNLPDDLVHTAAATVGSIIAGSAPRSGTLLLAGGGVRNRFLVETIRAESPIEVLTTDRVGIPPEFREAAAMAVLGALCQDRIPITLPQVTGVAPPVPGAGAWAMP